MTTTAHLGTLDLGMMRLAGQDVAIPAALVREVVPCPPTLAAPFGAAPGLIGSVVIRDSVIPVIDPRAMLGLAEDRDAPRGIIVVVCEGDWLLGIRLDSVSGIERIEQHVLQETQLRATEECLVPRSFVRGEQVVRVLDPHALFALPSMPMARTRNRSDARFASDGERRPAVMITTGGVKIGVDAELTAGTVPLTSLRPSPVPTERWRQLVDYLGFEVPVLGDLAALGLSGEPQPDANGAVIVLRIAESRYIGVIVEQMRGITRLLASQIESIPDSWGQGLTLFAGMFHDPASGQNLMIDSDACRNHPEFVRMAELCRPTGARAGTAATEGGATRSQRHLIIRAGTRFHACRLDKVREIIRFPGFSSATAGVVPGMRGLADHRGRALPLFDLDPAMPALGNLADLLVLRTEAADGACKGYLIDSLCAIEVSPAEPRPGAEGAFVMARIGGEAVAVNVNPLD